MTLSAQEASSLSTRGLTKSWLTCPTRRRPPHEPNCLIQTEWDLTPISLRVQGEREGKSAMTLVVRPARPDDATAIARVQVATWRTTYRGIVPDEYLDSMEEEPRARYGRDVTSRDAEAAGKPFVVVAEDTGRGVVGFAAAGPERRGDPHFCGELEAIYILQEYQRQGIGRRLVREVVQRLLQRGFNTMLVWVLAENPYRRFYEALGGSVLCSEQLTIGGKTLGKRAYGWDDIRHLAGTPAHAST